MRSAADAWHQTADYLEDTTEALDAAAGRVLENHRGRAAYAFRAHWNQWSADSGHLQETVADCRQLVRSLVDFAGDVDAADRTIMQLIELALESIADRFGLLARLLDLDDVWLQWLRENCLTIRTGLAADADRHGCIVPISSLAPALSSSNRARDRDVAAPSGVDLDLVDPDEIDWVDPGDPDDLGHLGTDKVDFGHGEGEIAEPDTVDPVVVDPVVVDPVDPVVVDPVIPVDPNPYVPNPYVPNPYTPNPYTPNPYVPTPTGGDGGSVTINVNGDNSVVTVVDDGSASVNATSEESGGSSSSIPASVPAARSYRPVDMVPPTSVPLSVPLARSSGSIGQAFRPAPAVGSTIDLTPIDGPETIVEPPTPDMSPLEQLTPTSTPSAVELGVGMPQASPVDVVPPADAPSTTKGRSGRMPFMPMMPMGGGSGGGSDDQEPKRKRVKK